MGSSVNLLEALEVVLEAFPRFSQGSLVAWVALTLALGGCGNDEASPPNASSAGSSGSSGNASGGSAAGSGGAQATGGASGSGKAPDGFTIAPGVDLSGEPATCSGFPDIACSGRCTTQMQEANGCQALAAARVFSEIARDASGTFISEQRSSSSSLWSIDGATGTLLQLAEPPGDNMHLRLALDDQLLYFISNHTLYSVPRAGGEPSELLPELPNANEFAVVGGRMFAKIALEPEVHELDWAQGTSVVHNRDTTSLLREGTDLYFAEAGTLYRAVGADIAAASMLASPVTTILGFVGDSLYAVGGADTERAVRRFPKAGGNGEVVFTLGAQGLAALANDGVAFTRQDGSRHYVCTVGLDGKTPTVHGYLSTAPSLLAADEHYVYVTFGFNMARMER